MREQQIAAKKFQKQIRTKGDYAHVSVRARGIHLNVEVEDDGGERRIIARATPLGSPDAEQYGLSFRTHTGRWEPMPVWGTIEEVAEGLVSCRHPYFDTFLNLRAEDKNVWDKNKKE